MSAPQVRIWPGRVRAAYADALGEGVTLEAGFGPLAVHVAPEHWVEAVALARDGLECTFFDFLTAVDEAGGGFLIVCHLARHHAGSVEHLVVRTLLPHTDPSVPTVAHLFPGARWHERETHEMFGVDFTEDGEVLPLAPLLLPEEFEGHPLRKDFVLASRVVKPWPGAKDPGESDASLHAGPPRRRARPPGVPDPLAWGPTDG